MQLDETATDSFPDQVKAPIANEPNVNNSNQFINSNKQFLEENNAENLKIGLENMCNMRYGQNDKNLQRFVNTAIQLLMKLLYFACIRDYKRFVRKKKWRFGELATVAHMGVLEARVAIIG